VADLADPGVRTESEVLKLAVQRPVLMGPRFDVLGAEAFSLPEHVTLYKLIVDSGGTAAAGPGGREWVDRLLAVADDGLRGLVTRFAVEELRAELASEERYADGMLTALEMMSASRAIEQVKSRLQRLNPVEEQQEYNRLFGELMALEQQRRLLRERAAGS
jgi:DNA primase